MSEFKGTKGEWQVKRKLNVVVGNQPLCDAWSFGDISSEEACYNAQLISCSLEMLKLLQEIAKENVSQHYFKINELINKATL